ncbi:hypothetical protein CUMW_069100, partial [Citrus unshiu]
CVRGTTEGRGAPEPTAYQTVWHKKGQHSNTARKGRGERALAIAKAVPFLLFHLKIRTTKTRSKFNKYPARCYYLLKNPGHQTLACNQNPSWHPISSVNMGDYNDAFMRNQNAAVQARTKAQNRANVLQLKLIGQSHPTGLTANLLKLFEPRAPLEYKPPPEKRKCPPLTGMAQFVSHFAEPGDPLYAPPVEKAETPVERRARIHKLRLEKGAEKAAEELKKYDPHNDPNVSGDPYKTLFVARLSYETTESKIKREFESYGPIKRVRLVTDKETNKPRGYAFIEYMHTRDMKAAYKQADGRKLDGRRVLVDVERGRTVPNWRPRRLGGGLGTTRVGGEEVNQRYSGREQEPSRGPSRSAEPRIREDRHGDRFYDQVVFDGSAGIYQRLFSRKLMAEAHGFA